MPTLWQWFFFFLTLSQFFLTNNFMWENPLPHPPVADAGMEIWLCAECCVNNWSYVLYGSGWYTTFVILLLILKIFSVLKTEMVVRSSPFLGNESLHILGVLSPNPTQVACWKMDPHCGCDQTSSLDEPAGSSANYSYYCQHRVLLFTFNPGSSMHPQSSVQCHKMNESFLIASFHFFLLCLHIFRGKVFYEIKSEWEGRSLISQKRGPCPCKIISLGQLPWLSQDTDS